MATIPMPQARAMYAHAAMIVGATSDDLIGESRDPNHVLGRWLVMRAMKDAGAEIPDIACRMGMHRASVMHGIAKLAMRARNDGDLKLKIRRMGDVL